MGAPAELSIRRAEPDDWPGLWEIVGPVLARGDTYAFPPDISEAAARALWLEQPAATYAAWRGGRLVGTYYLKANQPGQGSHVANAGYMVHPAARGQGVGGAMCADSLEKARRLGFSAMQFNLVVATNTGAIALWKAHGFRVVGVLPRAFAHPAQGLVDALVMHRLLDA